MAEENLKALGTEGKALKRYLACGGFIQDRNGKWCKDGDRIKVTFHREGSEIVGEKPVDEEKEGVLRWMDCEWAIHHECEDGCFAFGGICIGNIGTLELVEPCEPDICKDFKEE